MQLPMPLRSELCMELEQLALGKDVQDGCMTWCQLGRAHFCDQMAHATVCRCIPGAACRSGGRGSEISGCRCGRLRLPC